MKSVDFVKLMDPKKLVFDKSDEIFEDSDWIAEKKINGRRIQCLVDACGNVLFAGRYARFGSEKLDDFCDKFYKIKNDIQQMQLPKLTLLDGEVYLPGYTLSETMQVMNSNIDDSIKYQEQKGFLKYVVFDVIAYDSKFLFDATTIDRKLQLSRVIHETYNIELAKFYMSSKDKNDLWTSILDSDCEEKGIVFKHCEVGYECKRSKWWKKLKTNDTFDAIITGFNYHKTFPNDFVSSIKVSQYRGNSLVHVTDVGGLTKQQAFEFRCNIGRYTGKVIQFKADFRTQSSYKNPRYDCLRPDKMPEDCIW